jgi:photosystem II stability/assembly factor-like uncharacterized protein
MKYFFPFFLLFSLCIISSLAQSVRVLAEYEQISWRGLSVWDDSFVVVSGQKGKIGFSKNGGRTWEFYTIKNYEQRDFRDIEMISESVWITMAVGSPGIILRTENQGQDWVEVYKDDDPNVFLDDVLTNSSKAWCIGDPLNGSFYLLESMDKGKTWKKINFPHQPKEGEAFFAASGSNMIYSQKKLWFVTGGKTSRLLSNSYEIILPLKQGSESTGANAIDYAGDRMIIVGGDFSRDSIAEGSIAIVKRQGNTWQNMIPSQLPSGYRSGVAWVYDFTWITVGLNGVDFSTDNGMQWKKMNAPGFHAVKRAKHGKTVFMAGAKGRIGKLIL